LEYTVPVLVNCSRGSSDQVGKTTAPSVDLQFETIWVDPTSARVGVALST